MKRELAEPPASLFDASARISVTSWDAPIDASNLVLSEEDDDTVRLPACAFDI